jgi:hypothetical protein
LSPILGIYASQISGHLWPASSYESIATVDVGSGGTASISFTSIPQTYTHLQIRGTARGTSAVATSAARSRFNSDNGANYVRHSLQGDGASASSAAATSVTAMSYGDAAGGNASANVFGVFVADILDYTNTNKYKTIRALNGFDNNGNGIGGLKSGLWMNTSAVTDILILPDTGNWAQYSSFALYGIKVAA